MMLLSKIHTPVDLRQLSLEQLPQLCGELREFIIEQVAVNGGHLGASLGTVELTVALHYAFDTPQDLLVWDVGHQAYGHKILTERQNVFSSNRKLNGISGFPKRTESQYDTFGVGHSSTSISAALGMATAALLMGKTQQQHIAVIGDGGLTAGMAFEALNHAGGYTEPPNLLIILNDNQMSIDENVGALNGGNYSDFFKALQIPLLATVDGHEVIGLTKLLQEQKKNTGLRAIHCKTIKGKGYQQAENDQITWHSPGLFDKVSGMIHKKVNEKPQPPKYQDVFGQTLVELARQNPQIVGVTPAMLSGSSMRLLMQYFPQRTFDVGIAEQHAVTFAAGLATQGYLPYCNIYSTFLQRAYDQLIHDVCLQRLKVIFCLDRAGLVGADGATHHGAFDLAFLRCIPNLIIAAPYNEAELRNLLYTAQLPDNQLSMAIRYPRGQGVLIDWQKPFEAIPIGKGQQLRQGNIGLAILSIGHVGNFVEEACQQLAQEGIFPSHYAMRFVKPLDTNLLDELMANHHTLLTVEDGCVAGGFGSAVLEYLSTTKQTSQVIRLGIPDEFIEHGEPQELQELCGFHTKNLIKKIKEI